MMGQVGPFPCANNFPGYGNANELVCADAKFNDTFMMTFKSFSSVDEVFDMLVARFNIQPPDGLTPEQLEEWKKIKKAPIRLRSVLPFSSSIYLCVG